MGELQRTYCIANWPSKREHKVSPRPIQGCFEVLDMDVKNWEEMNSNHDLWRQEPYKSLQGGDAKQSADEHPEDNTNFKWCWWNKFSVCRFMVFWDWQMLKKKNPIISSALVNYIYIIESEHWRLASFSYPLSKHCLAQRYECIM